MKYVNPTIHDPAGGAPAYDSPAAGKADNRSNNKEGMNMHRHPMSFELNCEKKCKSIKPKKE